MEGDFLCQPLLHIAKQCLRHDGICRARENASPIVRQLGGESSGAAFRRKRLYAVMVRFVVPVMMLILFLQSTGIMA